MESEKFPNVLFLPAFNLVKMINFNIPFHPFLTVFLCALGGDARAVSVSVQINSFASLLYNFLKLLVSKIIISHFHKILLNG